MIHIKYWIENLVYISQILIEIRFICYITLNSRHLFPWLLGYHYPNSNSIRTLARMRFQWCLQQKQMFRSNNKLIRMLYTKFEVYPMCISDIITIFLNKHVRIWKYQHGGTRLYSRETRGGLFRESTMYPKIICTI